MPISLCKYHGGKGTLGLQKWILSHFPANYQELTYIEPFCGAASIFLNKKPSASECLGDLDCDIINLLSVVRNNLAEFTTVINEIEYTKDNFVIWKENNSYNHIERAVKTYICQNYSRGGLGRDFAWSDRIRRKMPGDVSGYLTKRAKLGIISQRLQNAQVYNADYFYLLNEYWRPDTLVYIDCPYLQSTRTAKNIYKCEFDEKSHIKMLNIVQEYPGKVMISGYDSPLYRMLIPNWKCHQKEVPNNSGQGKTKNRRIECLWTNWK